MKIINAPALISCALCEAQTVIWPTERTLPKGWMYERTPRSGGYLCPAHPDGRLPWASKETPSEQ